MSATTEPLVQVPAAAAPAAYGTVAKWLHWITAVLVGIALPIGFAIKYFTTPSEAMLAAGDAAAQAYLATANGIKYGVYAIHESAGLTIFFVVLLRLLWRQVRRPPPLPAGMPAFHRKVSAAVHHSLYALLLLQAALGFLATNAWGFPMQGATAYLGFIDLPKFTEANTDVAGALQYAHTIGGYAILVLLVLHIGGAIYHQAIRRDGTLLRMV